jgi:hypothetical protein
MKRDNGRLAVKFDPKIAIKYARGTERHGSHRRKKER